jgi:hypothetical protein
MARKPLFYLSYRDSSVFMRVSEIYRIICMDANDMTRIKISARKQGLK